MQKLHLRFRSLRTSMDQAHKEFVDLIIYYSVLKELCMCLVECFTMF